MHEGIIATKLNITTYQLATLPLSKGGIGLCTLTNSKISASIISSHVKIVHMVKNMCSTNVINDTNNYINQNFEKAIAFFFFFF